jgi:hypothetical protein
MMIGAKALIESGTGARGRVELPKSDLVHGHSAQSGGGAYVLSWPSHLHPLKLTGCPEPDK